MTRARYAALLPRTSVRWARGWDQAFRLSPTKDDPYRLQQSNGGRQWFELKATWNLDRLLFVNEEIPTLRMHRSWNEQRAKLAGIVIELLYTWQKLQLDSTTASYSPQQQLESRVAAAMTAMKLDTLTGGWFGKWLDANVPPPAAHK